MGLSQVFWIHSTIWLNLWWSLQAASVLFVPQLSLKGYSSTPALLLAHVFREVRWLCVWTLFLENITVLIGGGRRGRWVGGGGRGGKAGQDGREVKEGRPGSDSVKLSSLFSLWSVLHIFLSHWVQHWKTCWCITPIWVGYSSRCNNKLEILAVVWVCGKLLSTEMTGQIPGFVGGETRGRSSGFVLKRREGGGSTRGGG